MWLRISRRFSLRTLLLALTVVSIALGMYLRSVSQQKAAVAALQAMGGAIAYDEHSKLAPWVPQFVATRLGRDYFQHVTGIELTSASATSMARTSRTAPPQGYFGKWVRRLPKTTRVVLDSPLVTDNDLQHVASLRHLTSLSIFESCRVTDSGYSHLRGHAALTVVDLWSSQITDATCEALSTIRTLTNVTIGGERHITDAGLTALSRLPLEKLTLTASVTDEGTRVLRRVETLKSLHLTSDKILNPGRVQAFLDDYLDCFVWPWNGMTGGTHHRFQESDTLLARHFHDDWGEASEELVTANEKALLDGSALTSVFRLKAGEVVHVITEAAGPDGRRGPTKIVPFDD